MLSRNFNLQVVGGIDWIRENYDFDAIAKSVDELIILNVNKEKNDLRNFSSDTSKLSENYFYQYHAAVELIV